MQDPRWQILTRGSQLQVPFKEQFTRVDFSSFKVLVCVAVPAPI
jgi:hypothetical protein